MLTTLMKWGAAAALAILLLSRSFPSFAFVLAFVVFGGASAVVFQALRASSYPWTAIFLPVALLFNPVVPVAFPFRWSIVLDLSCIVLFILSLRLQSAPRMTIASITQSAPPGRSL